jgi:hypothetical protein
MLCASATCTRYDGMCRLYTAGLLVSVVAIGTATEATAIVQATRSIISETTALSLVVAFSLVVLPCTETMLAVHWAVLLVSNQL